MLDGGIRVRGCSITTKPASGSHLTGSTFAFRLADGLGDEAGGGCWDLGWERARGLGRCVRLELGLGAGWTMV